MKLFTRLSFGLAVSFACFGASPLLAETVTFEGLLSSPETFYNGDNDPGGPDRVVDGTWTADGVSFQNEFVQQTFPGPFVAQSWSGWAYSNTTDSTTPGFGNQYSAAPGGGSDGVGGAVAGETYALAFNPGATFNLPSNRRLQSFDWTNGTYASLSMENGDSFAKKFGGTSGTDPDFFRAILTGYSDIDGLGASTGSVTLSMADFTASDSSDDFITNTWQIGEDLTSLGAAQSVVVSFESSDVGTFGINTPQYFFMDNLSLAVAIPEPSSAALLVLLGTGFLLRRRRFRSGRPE